MKYDLLSSIQINVIKFSQFIVMIRITLIVFNCHGYNFFFATINGDKFTSDFDKINHEKRNNFPSSIHLPKHALDFDLYFPANSIH